MHSSDREHIGNLLRRDGGVVRRHPTASSAMVRPAPPDQLFTMTNRESQVFGGQQR